MKFRYLHFIALLATLPLVFSPTALADSLSSTPNGSVLLPSNEKSAFIEYQIPIAVVLGNSDTVLWSVEDITTVDKFGNISSDLSFSNYPVVKYSLTPIGRRATFEFSSLLAGKFKVTVEAKVGLNTYTLTKEISVSSSPTIVENSYGNGSEPTVEIDTPDVGKDLQTVVRIKIKQNLNTSEVGILGPYYINLDFKDSKGNYIGLKNIVEEATPGQVFSNYDTLDWDFTDGSHWINIPITYTQWLSTGGISIDLNWDSNVHNGSIRFSKSIPISVNFPTSSPSLNSGCGEVLISTEGSCYVTLSYTDSLGKPASGANLDINWVMTVGPGRSIVARGVLQNVKQGTPNIVAIPHGDNEVTLIATIAGTSIQSSSVARVHVDSVLGDFEASSMEVLQNCPESFSGGKVRCDFEASIVLIEDVIVPLVIEEKIDGGSWKRVQSLKLRTNTNKSLTLPGVSKKSIAVRSYVLYDGEKYYSEISQWTSTSNSLTSLSSVIKKGLMEGCTNLPSSLNIKYKSTGNYVGNSPGGLYSVNNSLNLVIKDGGSNWIFSAYPPSGQNQITAAKWNCGSGGSAAVMRIYFVPK